MEVRTADATFSAVSLALDDVRCHLPVLFLHVVTVPGGALGSFLSAQMDILFV